MKRFLPALILLVLLVGTFFYVENNLNKSTVPELYQVPDFEFKSQLDLPFSNKNFSNKISVANFIFTNCPGICPVMSREMHTLYTEYESFPEIQFVSFSVDPDRDSLQALISYAESWGVSDNRWLFLKTEKETIQKLYEEGFKLGGELPFGHATRFVLIDNKNSIRGYYSYDDAGSIEQLKNDIATLSYDL